MKTNDKGIVRGFISALMMSVALLSVGLAAHSGQCQENAENQQAAAKLAEGSTAPQFRLQDQGQKERSLKDELTKSEWTALLFYRSADW